jgi:exopolyphosphatase/pppGpp-phosphohydrolase
MESQVNPAGPRAAVDIGSNSYRLEIGQLPHGR